MKTMTTIAAASLLVLSSSAMAEQQLTSSEMDGVTAGFFSATAIADAIARGGFTATNTTAISEVITSGTPSVLAVAASDSDVVGSFVNPNTAMNSFGVAVGAGSATDSASTVSQTESFARFGTRTAFGVATNTTIANGPSSQASSSSVAGASIGPFVP